MAAGAVRIPEGAAGTAAGRVVGLYFICIGNATRSQMAEGFARACGGENVDARSGGTRPAGFVASKAVEVMAEKGIDISRQRSKPLDPEFAERADAVVSMGCGVEKECPAVFLERAEDWSIPDPTGLGIEEYREARDAIEGRVRALLARLGIPVRLS